MARVSETPRLPWVARLWSNSALRYLLVGGFCFLADVVLLWLGHEVLGIDLAVSTAAAFLLSFAITYTLQRIVAFDSNARVAGSVLKYTLLVAINALATTAIVSASSLIGVPWIVGKVAAVVLTTIWNYFAYRYWVFAPRKMDDV